MSLFLSFTHVWMLSAHSHEVDSAYIYYHTLSGTLKTVGQDV